MDLEVSKYYVASQKKNVEYNSDNFFLLWKLSSNLGGHSKSGRGRGGRDQIFESNKEILHAIYARNQLRVFHSNCRCLEETKQQSPD